MKFLTLIIIFILFQPPKVITLENYYCGEGVIFGENEKYFLKRADFFKPFVPNIEDVKRGEDFLFSHYYEHETKIRAHFGLDIASVNLKYKKPENVKKKFKKYNRQYVGYINTEKDTILYLSLLNFSNKKRANDNFDGWKEYVFVGAGDYYYENQKFFTINLSKNRFIYNVSNMSD